MQTRRDGPAVAVIRDSFEAQYRRALLKRGERMFRARFDINGNCLYCGEAGRCPGWHTKNEISNVMATITGGLI